MAEKKVTTKDYSILIKPVLTEKGAGSGNPVFWVDKRAGKDEIKAAVERVFSVKVKKVRTVNMLGKPKRKGQSVGRRADGKKAYVVLQEGQKIELIEGV